MVATYIVILACSAALAAWSALRISRRLETMLGATPVPAGLFAVLSAIGFLIIVAMPSSIAVGALLLVIASAYGMRHTLPLYARFGVPFIAVLLGLSSLHLPPVAGLPVAVSSLAAAALWLLATYSATALPDAPAAGSLAASLILAPLATASLFGTTPAFLALDALLLLAPLAGVRLAGREGDALRPLCRLPYGFLMGWLVLVALAHHAYAWAGLSIGFWLAVVLVGLVRTPTVSFNAPAL